MGRLKKNNSVLKNLRSPFNAKTITLEVIYG